MRRVPLLALLLVALCTLPAEGRSRSKASQPAKPAVVEQEVLKDFEQILDLWRDGKYVELYDRTSGGSGSREQFIGKLSSALRRPACCWEKMQEAMVSLQSERAAVVRARLGFEGDVSGTQYVTKGIKLKKEGGIWVISQSELFTLAGVTKKKARYKYLPLQGKK